MKLAIVLVFLFICSTHYAEAFENLALADLPDDIYKLCDCESDFNPNVRVLDTNGYYSYGILQFQLYTFINYGKKHGILPKELTENEARILIYNPHVQVAIAKEILKEPKGYRHWLNCAIKKGIA